MTDHERINRWERLYAGGVEGWDFSEFEGRVEDHEMPWSYDELAREALRDATAVLDLGTGGGELLVSLGALLPEDTHATEGWPPNVPVARRALAPWGIPVSEYDAEQGQDLPFPGNRFDLVLDKHESYTAAEVARVLRPGGRFLTQQVGCRNLGDLRAVFGGGTPFPQVNLAAFRADVERAGLVVERAEDWTGEIRFPDVDTLLSYLRWMPWELPDHFTVARWSRELLELEHSAEPLVFTEARFLLECRKPA